MPEDERELPLGELWIYLRPYRWQLAASGACLLVAVPLVQVHPLIWRYVVDDVLMKNDPRLLWAPILLSIAAQVLGASIQSLQTFLLERVGQGFVRDTRNAVFAKLSAQSLGYHHDRRTGDLVTRVVSDVEAMENSVLRGLSTLVEEFFTFLLVAGIVIALQPVVGICSLVPLLFSFAIIRIFGVRVKAVYERVRDRLGAIGSFVHDRMAGVQLTQAFSQREAELKSFGEATEAHYRQSMRATKLRAFFFPAVGAFGFLSSVVMLGMGAWFILRGEFTIGGLLAYRGYWWRLQSPINVMARTSDILFRARAAAQRVVRILHEPLEIDDAPGALAWRERRGEIAFRDVCFQYAEARPLLRHVTFRIAPGEFVAIAGRSGSGKTTLLNLIPRFYEPSPGSVLIDGVSAGDYALASLRGGIGMVLQETFLFNDTVAANIRYAAPAASRDEVERAARAANAHEFIAALPDGYETVVGERGVKLSGGQRQRLSLARAFLSNPTIILLDEPTSSVEPESEELIHRALLELSRDRTTLLVTHRVSLLRRAPRILFLAHGEVVGDGAHRRLIETCPAYAEAYVRWEAEEPAEIAAV